MVETAAKSIIPKRIRSLCCPVDPSTEVEAPRTFSLSSSGPPVVGLAEGDAEDVGEGVGEAEGDGEGVGVGLALWAWTREAEIKNAINAMEAMVKRSNL